MTKDLLIIFVRNPELHKVKTRLSASVGPEEALRIYQMLLNRTHAITEDLDCAKIVYYADYLPQADIWEELLYSKKLQQGQDLGERMENAFAFGFAQQYERVCIIGSDCYELTSEIIQTAFQELVQQPVVLGPATDGGYYLLGMNQFYPALFQNISWSTPNVLTQTQFIAQKHNLKFSLLPILTDVDEEKDLVTMHEK